MIISYKTLKGCFQKASFFICCLASTSLAARHTLTAPQKKEIGMCIWHNEGGGRYDRLVFWKENEKFPSLGIAHFIWYPKKNADIYTQTFPNLITFFKKHNVKLPAWLSKARYAPWKTKEEFTAQSQSARTQELRKLMHDTIDLQVAFIIERLERAWPRILKAADPKKKKSVEQHYHALMQTAQGTYAVLDYLNFKGEGTDPKERYNGVGWGLLQVLEEMECPSVIPRKLRTNGQNTIQKITTEQLSSVRPERAKDKTERILEDFITAAKSVLTTRVSNAPADKAHEKQWLQGWHNRVNSYKTFKTT